MLTPQTFRTLLTSRQTLLLDGALATELEFRGHNLQHALWSAKLLQEDPESIQKLHLEYFLAGADIVITSSYQASVRGLVEHFRGQGEEEDDDDDEEDVEEKANALIRLSVQLADRAREEAYLYLQHPTDSISINPTRSRKELFIAGSIGPFGAYLADGSEYQGDYNPRMSREELKDFHRGRIKVLMSSPEGGVDLLALETMPNIEEIRALVELLREEFEGACAWLSCTARDANRLSDGTEWKEVVDAVKGCDQIVAMGVNCVSMNVAAGALRILKGLTELPLVCYPNSGEIFDTETKTWHGERLDDVLENNNNQNNTNDSITACNLWTSHGAKLIGGCCRTGPAFVKALDRALELRRG